MQGFSFHIILFLLILGSINVVLGDDSSVASPSSDPELTDNVTNKNRYFNVLLRRRSHTTKEFYAYVDLVRGMHMDPKRPKFRAEIVKVLLNMKTITVKNPTKAALKFFNSNRDIVDMVNEELKDIEAEL
mmetsp:Transcript_8681/g.14723  ORF Transcript_8681/g.14723 Transcript_8681/m.14723 type:complete len:130 (-) Transcript_8681:342-731(-)